MAVQNKVLYAFRGWIAFVAFMDMGTAGRSYIEKRSFLSNNSDDEHFDGKFLLRQMGNFRRRKAGNPVKNKHV
ncbi:unnamed protein product [Leptidea sinapis]|uniref:Uncharacterized protein n=1 Tax=Leptidea sinapis TaxID=189913 RepID=A0A5E4QJN5_9NEOP|nr:unnamed protein product [Leptidea sinapis]